MTMLSISTPIMTRRILNFPYHRLIAPIITDVHVVLSLPTRSFLSTFLSVGLFVNMLYDSGRHLSEDTPYLYVHWLQIEKAENSRVQMCKTGGAFSIAMLSLFPSHPLVHFTKRFTAVRFHSWANLTFLDLYRSVKFLW
ncbi:unnamed protein product [Thelazia callipaeda]|uniref:HCO3_cotransp domain-containing protein n=1 Tax=Thelazia callipaeda TaxID=103827 RepID=A0A0N5CVY3_THECL|nr:unnamed protein product [Thelazia callipaeda]